MDIVKTRELLRTGKTIFDLKLRVGYYGRVSTDKDDQVNSLENQKNYFEDMVRENPNWTLVGGFLDEGISGTAVKNRTEFLKMIELATLGKIDLIITKEISRFSRNTVDSIKYTQFLLNNGVIVYFLSDNLNTIGEDSEFRLTIMASMAQDEVRKTSERVKFSVNRRIKERKLLGGNLTGYFKNKGKFEINDEEAKMIRYLFETYASGRVGLKKIGLELAEMGYLNSKGEPYSQTSLARMLSNPRYKGYYTARLTEVRDYKTHKKERVENERQIIEKCDNMPAIVSEELWDKANNLHQKRKSSPASHILNTEKALETYKYSCKMYCKECGSVFTRNGGSNRRNNPKWSCKRYKSEGVKVCASPNIPESYLDKIFISIFEELLNKKKDYFKQIYEEYKNIIEKQNINNSTDKIKKDIQKIKIQKDKLLDLSIKGILSDLEFKERNDKFNLEIKTLEEQLPLLGDVSLEQQKLKKKLDELYLVLKKDINIKEELPSLMRTFIDRIEVEKINGDRKHIRLIIYFDFKNDIVAKELDLSIKSNKSTFSFNKMCNCINSEQSRVCKTRSITWKRKTIFLF